MVRITRWHIDVRGVKTLFNYKDVSNNPDPLNRLQSVSYDTAGVATSITVLPAATVNYQYRPKTGTSDLIDITQPKQNCGTIEFKHAFFKRGPAKT